MILFRLLRLLYFVTRLFAYHKLLGSNHLFLTHVEYVVILRVFAFMIQSV